MAGGSSGKIGPFVGAVTQTFIDDVKFVNSVELGPLRLALQAKDAEGRPDYGVDSLGWSFLVSNS